MNAQVGLSAAHCRSLESSSLIAKLEDIQSSIFDIGAAVASHSSKSEKVKGNLEIAKFRFHRVKVSGYRESGEYDKVLQG